MPVHVLSNQGEVVGQVQEFVVQTTEFYKQCEAFLRTRSDSISNIDIVMKDGSMLRFTR